jgi:hypothetical protein
MSMPEWLHATLTARARGGAHPALVVSYRTCHGGRARLDVRALGADGWKAHATITAVAGRGGTLLVARGKRPHARVTLRLHGAGATLSRTVRA